MGFVNNDNEIIDIRNRNDNNLLIVRYKVDEVNKSFEVKTNFKANNPHGHTCPIFELSGLEELINNLIGIRDHIKREQLEELLTKDIDKEN